MQFKHRHRRRQLIGILALLTLSAWSNAQPLTPDSILGQWVLADGSARVQIYKTASEPGQENYAVRIAALRDPTFTPADDEAHLLGKPRRDIHNPDAELRQRLLVGLTIGSGFSFERESWRGGYLYHPGSGKRYRCHLQLIPGGYLRVRGYIGFSLLGRTMVWQRALDFQLRVDAMLARKAL